MRWIGGKANPPTLVAISDNRFDSRRLRAPAFRTGDAAAGPMPPDRVQKATGWLASTPRARSTLFQFTQRRFHDDRGGGRVQTPTLAILAGREKKNPWIQAARPYFEFMRNLWVEAGSYAGRWFDGVQEEWRGRRAGPSSLGSGNRAPPSSEVQRQDRHRYGREEAVESAFSVAL